MNDLRRYYAGLMACLLVLFPVCLSIAVLAIQQNKISLQGFRGIILLLVGGFIAACAVLTTKIRKLPLTSETTKKVVEVQSNWTKVKVWNLRVLIVLMGFSLVFGNWVERDGPLAPRIVGTIANLALTWLLVKNLRWMQTKSK
jgi:H+/Cl- antiporter ClcA